MLLDLVYLLALLLLSPWLAWRALATGRYRREVGAKFLGRVRVRNPARQPVAWFHAVSVGEVNLLGTLVPAFLGRHPGWLAVVSATTDTGLAEARKTFPGRDVIPWPFDFSWAVAGALDAVAPALVVLTESELWPNFLAAAHKRNVPVVVVNARMSPRSFRRLTRVAGAARRLLFRHVARFAAQEAEYADRFRQLGVPEARVVTTGSIKYDGAAARNEQKTRALGAAIGLEEPTPNHEARSAERGVRNEEAANVVLPSPRLRGEGDGASPPGEGGRSEELAGVARSGVSVSPLTRLADSPPSPRRRGEGNTPIPPLWEAGPAGLCVLLAGSTHAPEEAIVLGVFARLRARFPQLRLILVPRHPDRFDEVARLVEASGLPFVRRSRVAAPLPEMPAVVLLDTVGDLVAAWGLADVGFTGGSLDGARGGQSMIEPAGYGVPCVFGPHVWNFKAAARRLVEVGGAVMVRDAAGLEAELARLVADPDRRARTGAAARELVRRQQGATPRTLDVLDSVLPPPVLTRAA